MRPALGILLLLIACQSAPQNEPAEQSVATPTIDSQTLLQRIADGDAPTILDVRRQDEFDAGHVEGAILVPYDELPSRELSWPKDDEIVVYCRSGRRARIAENYLREQGYSKLVHLEGDMLDWQAKGHPLVVEQH